MNINPLSDMSNNLSFDLVHVLDRSYLGKAMNVIFIGNGLIG